MLTTEHTKPDGSLLATLGAAGQVARLECASREEVAHGNRVNHHGCWLPVWLTLPVGDLNGRNVKQILSMSQERGR
jgi:hypothetical protein